MPAPKNSIDSDSLGESMEEYTEAELVSFGTITNEASYIERAQDFRPLLKSIRVRYLNLKPFKKELTNGSTITVYRSDKNENTALGINKKGIEETIRFIEPRLSKHTVLSNLKNTDKVSTIILDDMRTWYRSMLLSYHKFELDIKTLNELRILVNDLLEFTYLRPLENKERGEFKPAVNELVRGILGMNEKPRQNNSAGQSQPTTEQVRGELNY